MKTPPLATLVTCGFAAFCLLLVAIGPPRHAAPVVTASVPASSLSRVSNNGFTLTSVDTTLPDDDGQFPEGPHAAVINARCTACHSAGMALTQPPLSPAQWKGIVAKMRDVYRAPVDERDVPAILDYLTALSGQHGSGAPAGKPEVARGRPRERAARRGDGSG